MFIPEPVEAENFEDESKVILFTDLEEMIDDIVYDISEALSRIEFISGIPNIEESASILRSLRDELIGG